MRLIPFLLSIIVLMFSSCKESLPQASGLSVVTFNVQTFFDDVEDGDEFSPFTRYEGWSGAKYEKRLETLRGAIRDFLDADIIFFQELESETVLEDLLDSSLRRRGYVYYAVADINIPITVGFISKYNPQSVSLHTYGTGRPLLRCEFLIDGRQFVFYAIHAKSNLGDEEDNQEERKLLATLINSLARKDRYLNVVLLGDFNSEPVLYCEDLLSFTSGLSAAEIVALSSVPVTADVSKVGTSIFYDPFSDSTVPLGGEGTYYYNGIAYDYDRVLMNAVLCSNFPSFSIEIMDDINNNGFPYAYSALDESGFSDHFPVKLTLY